MNAASLTPERIERAALDLVDEAGLDGLTMRALGARLGADPTAVYRHFRNKEELLEALVDLVFGGEPPPAAADGQAPPSVAVDEDWRAQVRAVCQRLRQALLAHPAIVPIAVLRPPRAPRTFAGVERFLGMLRSAGFDDEETAAAYHTLLYYTLGHAALEAPYAQMPAEEADAVLTETRLGYLAQPPQRFPHTSAVAPHLYGELDQQFAYGLDRLLDGLADRLT